MLTSADGSSIRIEKDGFAPVVVHKGEPCSANEDDQLRLSETALRTLDGYYLETFLPDGTVVHSYKDWVSWGVQGYRHLYKRADYTVYSVNSIGQVDIISSNTRNILNEIFEKRALDQDTAYCYGIFYKNSSFQVRGVYHAFVMKYLNDPQVFTIHSGGNHLLSIDQNISLNAYEYRDSFYLDP